MPSAHPGGSRPRGAPVTMSQITSANEVYRHPRVVAALEMLWIVAVGGKGRYALSLPQYRVMHANLRVALAIGSGEDGGSVDSEWSPEQVQAFVAEHSEDVSKDWMIDTQGQGFLSYEGFIDMWLQLARSWLHQRADKEVHVRRGVVVNFAPYEQTRRCMFAGAWS